MHPVILGDIAHDHVSSLICDADDARLARLALGDRPGLRRRAGLRLIALGERLAPECPQSALPLRGGRA